MTRTTLFTMDELEPKHLDRPERFNDWYFTVHFVHEGKNCVAKFSITEGTLLGQSSQYSFSQDPVALREERDALVLPKPANDLAVNRPGNDFSATSQGNQVTIKMNDLTAMLRPEQQRIVSTNERLGGDLIFTPRGPVLHWEHEPGAVSSVTEVTRVSGSESMSDVKGVLRLNGHEIPIQGRGLFERVWFSALNFFQIRAMNWIYAHFDEMYVYICHCESATSTSQPFHFETGEAYMIFNEDFMLAESIDVSPEKWVYLEQVRRFVPLEQAIRVKTDQGTLRLKMQLAHYPILLQDPARLENLTVDNIPGWTTIFYDVPVALEGKFTYKDGRVVTLKNGVGMNEQIRISAL